jgi:hypothetical protein
MLLRNSRSLDYWFALSTFSLLLLLLVLGVQIHAVNAISLTKSPIESGYGHGCNDAGIIDLSDRYISQPGKGPSFHTEEFMCGYDTGYNECSNAME